MKTLKKLDVDKMTVAIDADAGRALPGLRDALAEAKADQFAQTHTPEQITRRRGRPVGSTQAVTKEAVKLRLDADFGCVTRQRGWLADAHQRYLACIIGAEWQDQGSSGWLMESSAVHCRL
ncbi:MAG: hypothetical protein WBF84_17140 [Castellaniella sp.]|uniref:hypothetical protein n=1 Tax=Castellaniella sp. TaxID=1955812 RepID=UPI003C756BFF